MRNFVKIILLVASVSVAVNSLLVPAEYKAISSNGSVGWLWPLMILVLPFLIVLGVIVCSILFPVPGRSLRGAG